MVFHVDGISTLRLRPARPLGPSDPPWSLQLGRVPTQGLPFLLRWLTKTLLLLNIYFSSIGFSRKRWGLPPKEMVHNVSIHRHRQCSPKKKYWPGKEKQQKHHFHPFHPTFIASGFPPSNLTMVTLGACLLGALTSERHLLEVRGPHWPVRRPRSSLDWVLPPPKKEDFRTDQQFSSKTKFPWDPMILGLYRFCPWFPLVEQWDRSSLLTSLIDSWDQDTGPVRLLYTSPQKDITFGGFRKWGYPKWFVYNGKSH